MAEVAAAPTSRALEVATAVVAPAAAVVGVVPAAGDSAAEFAAVLAAVPDHLGAKLALGNLQ